MLRKVGYVIVAVIATLLFFVAIGYHGWNCRDSILGPDCRRYRSFRITGVLLVIAGLILSIGTIFLGISVTMVKATWARFVGLAVSFCASILSIAAMFYYFDHMHFWSPFIASIAMSLTVALSITLSFDVIGEQKKQ